MTETKRLMNEKRRENGTDAIMALQDEGYKIERLSPFQWRVNNKLDLYPTNKRYHHLMTHERGVYQGAFDICRRLLK